MLPESKVVFKFLTMYANEVILVFTALCGYFLQYSYSKEKGIRSAFLMLVSSIFTGILLHLVLTHNGIEAGDLLHTAIIASSAAISSAIVTFFITIASLLSSSGPRVIFKKFEDFVENYGKKDTYNKTNSRRSSDRRRNSNRSNYESEDYSEDDYRE